MKSITCSLEEYGNKILEPWRDAVSDTIKHILSGAEILEQNMNNIFEECTNEETRISELEWSLTHTIRENESLKVEMENIRVRLIRLETETIPPRMEIEEKFPAQDETYKVLEKNLEGLRVKGNQKTRVISS